MFSAKNITPRQLAAFTALVLAVPIGSLIGYVEKSWWIGLVFFAVIFACSYFFISFMLERFIYRKIKLIYKFIYQTKATKKEEFFYENILPRKSLEELSHDVQLWADQKKDEIDMLRANEQFRKEFLMNLAHELRTPIFNVQGYVDTLLGGALEDEEVNRKFLTNASKGID